MDREQGAYAELEKSTAGKKSYLKRRFYFEIFAIAATVLTILILMSTTQTFSKDFFIIDLIAIVKYGEFEGTNLQLIYYVPVSLAVAFMWYLLFMKERDFVNDGSGSLKEEPIMSKISKIIFYPINLFIVQFEVQQYVKLKAGWFDSLDRKFFQQVHNVEDGYERVKELSYLRKIFLVYTKKEKKELIQLFKSEESLLDLYKITEGYLVHKDFEKFDDTMRLKRNNYENFRAFNGTDTVYFSLDYVLLKVDKESKNYRTFLQRRMLKGRTKTSREIREYFTLFMNDKKVIEKLLSIDNLEHQENDAKKLAEFEVKKDEIKRLFAEKNYKKIEKLIEDKMVLYFKFILTRVILQKYTNIPAGTAVSKVADYTLRAIIEDYNNMVLINITPKLNDGTSDSFNGDSLANIFLYTYNQFMHGRKEKVLDQIDRNINVDFLANTKGQIDETHGSDISTMFSDMNKYAKENKSSLDEFIKTKVLNKKEGE